MRLRGRDDGKLRVELDASQAKLKKYGDITYMYISEISRKHDWPKVRHATLKTGWLIKSTGAEGDFTSRQSQTQTVSHFPRTAIVTPLEVHIKQNYKDEARRGLQVQMRH